MRQRPPASPHRTGKEGGVSALALNRYVTFLRHYISLLLSFSVLSLFNAYRNLAHLAQFARVERDSALHCQRTQAMFVLARLPCMRRRATAVPLCLNRLLPAPRRKVGRHCLTLIQLVNRTQRFYISYFTCINIKDNIFPFNTENSPINFHLTDGRKARNLKQRNTKPRYFSSLGRWLRLGSFFVAFN